MYHEKCHSLHGGGTLSAMNSYPEPAESKQLPSYSGPMMTPRVASHSAIFIEYKMCHTFFHAARCQITLPSLDCESLHCALHSSESVHPSWLLVIQSQKQTRLRLFNKMPQLCSLGPSMHFPRADWLGCFEKPRSRFSKGLAVQHQHHSPTLKSGHLLPHDKQLLSGLHKGRAVTQASKTLDSKKCPSW